MKHKVTLITTTDNPFNPFNDFNDWIRFDTDKGYNTWSLVCRLAKLSNELSDDEYYQEISAACKEIAYFNLLGNYKKLDGELDDLDKA